MVRPWLESGKDLTPGSSFTQGLLHAPICSHQAELPGCPEPTEKAAARAGHSVSPGRAAGRGRLPCRQAQALGADQCVLWLTLGSGRTSQEVG